MKTKKKLPSSTSKILPGVKKKKALAVVPKLSKLAK